MDASALSKHLSDLWQIENVAREKAIKLLSKILNKILSNPSEAKHGDLNFHKVFAKFEKCKPGFYLLYEAGFKQSMDGTRLQWKYDDNNYNLLKNVNDRLQQKIKEPNLSKNEIKQSKETENSKYRKQIQQTLKTKTSEKERQRKLIKERIAARKKEQKMDQKRLQEKIRENQTKRNEDATEFIKQQMMLEMNKMMKELYKSDQKDLDESKQDIIPKPTQIRNNIISSKPHKITITNFEDIDFGIFASNSTKCTFNDGCDVLQRIVVAMRYHDLLCGDDGDGNNDNKSGQEMFIIFSVEVYRQFLDDYIHFVQEHGNNLLEIADELTNKYKYPLCNISNCRKMERHYTRNRDINESNDEDRAYMFYSQFYDQIHHFIFHIYALGLRVNMSDYEKRNTNISNHGYINCIDEEIIFIEKEIEKKRKKYESRFKELNINDNNTKFIIQQTGNGDQVYHDDGDEKKTDDEEEITTFSDEMISYIEGRIKDNELDQKQGAKILNILSVFVESEEYDTDCICLDIDIYDDCTNDNNKTCNTLLYGINNNIKYIECIKKFRKIYMKKKAILSNEFSTGFHFVYHSFYKNIDIEKQQQMKNEQTISQYGGATENDFGGICVSRLFVAAHFNSIKEEALNSGISFKQFEENVIEKANKFMQTEKCRKMSCLRSEKMYSPNNRDPLHFGIRRGTPLSVSQLYAVILYCDFTAFCTTFSSTFRRIKWNESLKSVKQRNSKYHHISKRLMELVQYYGEQKGTFGSVNSKVSTSFYTGVTCCTNIGEFSVRINGPTSTSKQMEVAVRFAGKEGLVLQINNQKPPGCFEFFFDSSWLSTYAEEDERIFFAARHKVELKTIIMTETAANYESFVSTFNKFDCILNGIHCGMDITKKDVFIMNSAISYIVDDSSNKTINKLFTYMYDNLYLFTNNKTQIILHLAYMDLKNIFGYKNSSIGMEFIGLIMYSMKMQKKAKETMDNLFKPIVFKLFPNLNEIIIYSTMDGSQRVYALNFLLLLSILTNNPLPKSFKTIIIKEKFAKMTNQYLFNSFSEKIKQEFAKKNLKIDLKTGCGPQSNEDWIRISL